MRTETKVAVAVTLGANLRRALLAVPAVITLASCGGGGGDEFEVTRSSNAWVSIDGDSANQLGLRNDFVNLRGAVFMGANSVSWANKTTGKSGQADHGVECGSFYFAICVHRWWAEIPIVAGANVIQVTASDGADNFETEAITITGSELTRPSISSAVPANGAMGIAPNSLLVVVFSEDMDRSTITLTTVLLEDSFGNQVAAAVTSTRSSATLDPTMQLAWSTTYRATITTGVRDLAGNALAAPHSWTFTTGVAPDTSPPVVASTTPPNGSACAAVDGKITATFSEAINASTVTASTFNVMDVNRNPISGAVSALTATSFAFTPSNALSLSTTYTATLTNGIRDLASNSLGSNQSWTFTVPSGIGAWQSISQTGSPVGGETAVWTGTEMIVWGGIVNSVGAVGTGGRYRPASDTWVEMASAGAPSPRSGHAAIWTGSEMIVWGGFRDLYFLDGAIYNPATDSWRPMSSTGAVNRSGFAAVWTGSELITLDRFGGARYNPVSDSWSPIALPPLPPVWEFSAIWSGRRMIVWANYPIGCDNFLSPCSSGGAAYDPTTNTWSLISITRAPSPRFGYAAVWTGTEMAVWGGVAVASSVQGLDTGALYNPQTDTWRPMSTNCGLSGRSGQSAVWDGTEIIVWGGRDEGKSLATGARYNPATDSWQYVTTAGAPSGLHRHSTLWTGTNMLIWGGSPIGAGGRYQP